VNETRDALTNRVNKNIIIIQSKMSLRRKPLSIMVYFLFQQDIISSI